MFSVFSRDEKFYKPLIEFLQKTSVKKSLGDYKIQRLDKSNLRYFIQCMLIRICPKLLLKVFNILR